MQQAATAAAGAGAAAAAAAQSVIQRIVSASCLLFLSLIYVTAHSPVWGHLGSKSQPQRTSPRSLDHQSAVQDDPPTPNEIN